MASGPPDKDEEIVARTLGFMYMQDTFKNGDSSGRDKKKMKEKTTCRTEPGGAAGSAANKPDGRQNRLDNQTAQATGDPVLHTSCSTTPPTSLCQCKLQLGVNSFTSSSEVPRVDPLFQKFQVNKPHAQLHF